MAEPNYAMQDVFLEKFFVSKFTPLFYLTGGTALARFYFHHRESVDVDLFSNEQSLDMDDVNRTIQRIGKDLGWTLQSGRSADAFLEYFFRDDQSTLKIDVVRDIPVHFGDVQKKGKIRIDSLENIGSNKVTAIYTRTVAKDFIDLYWIVHHSPHSFDALYRLAQKKDVGVTDLHYAYALEHVRGIQVFPVMLQPMDWQKITEYYIDLSKQLLTRVKPKE